MMVHTLEADEKENITEKAHELAIFEKGDLVTVEPLENNIPFAGRELVGVPLTVKDVKWRGTHVDYANRARAHPTRSLPDDHEERFVGDYYVNGVEYEFEEVDRWMPESSLITWDEYTEDHDRVHVLTDSREGYNYIEPAEEPCPVCGCNRQQVSGHDMSVVHIGQRGCAACGEVFERWD